MNDFTKTAIWNYSVYIEQFQQVSGSSQSNCPSLELENNEEWQSLPMLSQELITGKKKKHSH